ncbi:hypothetical protein SASPL_117200 [Salvia splendens]|uniref:Receptor-like serine/threonine-protein kinase n=1 Tax=Salvia splendens TaxID=180675 RepID=A0A8X8XX40_SALSN|nr:hypothetical protein SASPL_117200 [Salvia splendens]
MAFRDLPYHDIHLLLLMVSCFLGIAAATDIIRANESLTGSKSLISSGKRFKLSFFSPQNHSLWYLGIMFNVPEVTVAWVANRNKPLNDSSGTFQISSDGNLVILDGQKQIVWSTNLSTSVANRCAVLLDTGNLVLQDNSNNDIYVWESFQHASDAWLEKMKIFTDWGTNEKNILTSWTSPDDPTPGSFTMTIEPSNVPQTFVWKDGDPFWRSGPWNGIIFNGIPDMQTGGGYGVKVVSGSLGTAYEIFTYPFPSHLFHFILNSFGSLEQKFWSDEKKGWSTGWSSTRNECDMYGKCGPFGSCNAQDKPICSCFRGFVPTSNSEWEAGNWTSGCTRKTHLQCEQDGFVKLEGLKLPDHFQLFSLSEGECRDTCLTNCSCIAYAVSPGIGCLHWTHNLTDTQKFTHGGDGLNIRLARSELDKKKQEHRTFIATTGVLGFVLVIFVLKMLLKYRAGKLIRRLQFVKTKGIDKRYSEEMAHIHDKHGVKLYELPLFTFTMLSNATENFDCTNKLGQGGFGPVYKGKFPNGVEIAVKRLARSSNQGVEEFVNEVEVISRLQHRNLVRLLGCCVESEEKLLVYEYMPNGSLDAYLFGSHRHNLLTWKTRKLIIEGICRGLLYLHRDSRLKIIHRDLKASNILLDEALGPKISDFGMARIFCGNDDQANTTRVVGTFGYMPPEYALNGTFSEKSDVYSFGVLLLEIVSGKKHSSFDDQQLFLTAYTWELWNEGKIVKLMDPAIYEDDSGMEDDIVRYGNVGLLCVQEMAADRPNMATALSMLNCEILELPCPKQPAFVGTQSSTKRSHKVSVNEVTISVVEGR